MKTHGVGRAVGEKGLGFKFLNRYLSQFSKEKMQQSNAFSQENT